MIVHNKPIKWYANKIRKNEYFSQGMYGDGEWLGIFEERIGKTNAEDTIYTADLCRELRESLFFKSKNFYFSAPTVLKRADWTGIGERKIDAFLETRNLDIEFYEKDEWDKAMKTGELKIFIKAIREKNVVIISNKHLRKLPFYDHFIEIDYPNCFDQIERVIKEILDYGKPAVYLFSAGLPATLFVQRLHNKVENSWFLDVGSIWDAFVGIGEQRGWRKELYADPVRYKLWRNKYKNVLTRSS